METTEHIMQFFAYAHLPVHLQAISKPFCDLASMIASAGSPAPDGVLIEGVGVVPAGFPLPRNPECTVALRKLLESKDAAVRTYLAKE